MSANTSCTTIPSDASKPKKRGRPKNSKNKVKAPVKEKEKKKRGRPRLDRPKQFKMVLEEDDDYEVDYLSPEEYEDEEDDIISNYSENNKDDDYVTSLSEDSTLADDLSLGDFGPYQPFLEEDYNDDEDIPNLDLPPSSDDLLISNDLLLPALSVYEVLRHFRQILHISPMLFEDFCAALISSETSLLMSECHIVLLKALLREDDQNNIMFVPQDQKETSNSYFFFIDHLTWPEVVKQYIESYQEFDEVEQILEDADYPLVKIEDRIKVLELLCNLFVSSTKIRDELMMNGTIHYDDHCRACHKLGDLLCCETCPAVYHLACTNPPLEEVPENEWQCEICVSHKLNGVTNCEVDKASLGQYLRHDPIGMDRHGRKYWFLVRRIIVESESCVWYYSTNVEFQYLLTILDPERYEMLLCEAMKAVACEFPVASRITEDITKSALNDKDQQIAQISLIKERMQKMLSEEDRSREARERGFDLEKGFVDDSNLQAPNNDPIVSVDDLKKVKEEPVKALVNGDVADADDSTKTVTSSIETTNNKIVSNMIKIEAGTGTETESNSKPLTSGRQLQVNLQKFTLPPGGAATSAPNNSSTLLLKAGQKIHVPAAPTGLSTLKNLFVVKDGIKTPITLTTSGKILGSSSKIVLVNSSAAKISNSSAILHQNKNDSEMKKTQINPTQKIILSATPKTSTPGLQNQENSSENSPQAEASEENKTAFRLGEDKGYLQYCNQYVENNLALNKYQHKEEKDRERHMGNKYSLTGSAEFNWNGPMYGSKTKVVHTLRTMMFKFEEQIPLCFMHSRWEQYRKMWARMLIKNDSQKAFSIVLGILEQAIRNNVKRPMWKEYMGSVRLRRIVTSFKEDYEKKKKLKSKQLDDKIQKSTTWCKYPLFNPNSNLMKIKGEDYRSSGIGGWMWRSSTFRNKSSSSKLPVKIIKTEVNDVTESLRSDVIDVAAGLLDRRNGYYDKLWPTSKLDRILKIREAQKVNGKKVDEKMEVVDEKKIEEAREAAAKSFAKSTKVEQYQHARKVSRRFRRGRRDRVKISGERSESCKVWKLKVPKEGPKVKPVQVGPYLQSSLHRNHVTTPQMPLPWLFAATKGRKKNIFRIPLHELRAIIIRGGGCWCPRGFHHHHKNQNLLELYWPYPSPRPTISTAWRYKIQTSSSYASTAYLLRLLWHSIRWDEMATKPNSDDSIHAVNTDESIVTTELLKRRDVGLSGLRQEYFVRKIVVAIADQDSEIPRSETYTPSSRSGLRTRSRPISLRDRNKKNEPINKPNVQNVWLPEDHIELWQIRQFDLLLREERRKKDFVAKYTSNMVTSSSPTIDSKIHVKPLTSTLSSSAFYTKQLKISQPLLQQANALSKQQFNKMLPIGTFDKLPNSTQNSVIKLSDTISTNNKTGMQKITIKTPVQPSVSFVQMRTTSGNVIATPTILQPRTTQLVVSKALPKPIIIKQGLATGNLATNRHMHPTVKLPGASYKAPFQQPIQVQTKQGTSLHIPMATIPTRPIAKLQQQYQQQMQQKQQQTTNMQVKLTTSQLNQLMKADNNAIVNVAIKYSNGSPGMGQMQVLAPNKQILPTPGQQLMQCKVGNEVRRFVLTALPPSQPGTRPSNHPIVIDPSPTEQPTSISTASITSSVFPIIPSQTVMTSAVTSSGSNEVSVTAPSLRDRLEQLQQRTPDLLKQPSTDARRLMSDKDPLWGGSLSSRPMVADNARLNAFPKKSIPANHHRPNSALINTLPGSVDVTALDVRTPRNNSVRKRTFVSRDQREDMQRRNVANQLIKSILDRIDRKEELEARKKKKEKLAEMQRKKRESLDEARSNQRLQSRLTLALKRHQEMLKQEIRKRQIITEKYLTKMVENQLFEDTLASRREKRLEEAAQAAAYAEFESRREKRRIELATSSRNACKRPRDVIEKQPAPQEPVLLDSSRSDSYTTSKKRSPVKRSFQKTTSPTPQPQIMTSQPVESAPKKKKMISTSEQLYCICRTPYDDSKFYIGCDLCTNWYHAECVNITKRMAKVMDTWICPDCSKVKPQEELYCICKTPYDDSQFYIGCDVCQDWFHGSCVQISQSEAELMGSYTCPHCRDQQRDASNEESLNSRDFSNLTKIVRQLVNHKMSWPFREPVRESDAPGYYKVVKRPMDLQTVMKRLNVNYYKKLSDLVGDVSLIFDNCRQYNGVDSSMVRCAEIVETVFVGKIRDLRGRR